jgi:hypothetical protein
MRREIIVAVIAAVVGAVSGAVSGAVTTWVLGEINGPPSDEIVMRLMDQEVAAGTSRNLNLADIYTRTATVMDAGCQTRGSGRAWSGLAAIEERYKSLPQLDSLSHANRVVTWMPNNRRARRAGATADTVGGTRSADGTVTPISGHELWEFARVNGEWRIASFTYNLCLP